MSITIPASRAARHGGPEFYSSGLKFAETLITWGGLRSTDRVLDVGCGPGRIAIGIGETFGWTNRYLGIDVIRTDIKVANQNITSAHRTFQFKHIDVHNGLYNPNGLMKSTEVRFPLDDQSVDFVLASSLFTHMFDADVKRYVSEIGRVMVPGGKILTTWFALTPEVLERSLAGMSRFQFSHQQPDGTRTTRPEAPEEILAFDQTRIQALFAEAGFAVTAFHRGAWSRAAGFKEARHSQDCYVCTKL